MSSFTRFSGFVVYGVLNTMYHPLPIFPILLYHPLPNFQVLFYVPPINWFSGLVIPRVPPIIKYSVVPEYRQVPIFPPFKFPLTIYCTHISAVKNYLIPPNAHISAFENYLIPLNAPVSMKVDT